MTNAESLLTAAVRKVLEARGAHCIKISDRFTRGVPDLSVMSNRHVWVEFKVGDFSDVIVTEYGTLGMSGAQDHHVRHMCRRVARSACCLTGNQDGTNLVVWVPVNPETELVKLYRAAAKGDKAAYAWLLGETK